jgi:hypothetical protein
MCDKFIGAFEAVSTSGIQDVEVVVSSAEEIPATLASPRKAAPVAQTAEMSDVSSSVVDIAITDLPVKTDVKVVSSNNCYHGNVSVLGSSSTACHL